MVISHEVTSSFRAHLKRYFNALLENGIGITGSHGNLWNDKTSCFPKPFTLTENDWQMWLSAQVQASVILNTDSNRFWSIVLLIGKVSIHTSCHFWCCVFSVFYQSFFVFYQSILVKLNKTKLKTVDKSFTSLCYSTIRFNPLRSNTRSRARSHHYFPVNMPILKASHIKNERLRKNWSMRFSGQLALGNWLTIP